MCGISGIISLDGKQINNLEKKIKLMTQLLRHRGPDQEGIFISKKRNIGLSNNRLSIVAPKENIDLPFTKNKNEFLSFNGEIYNYLSLKEELEKKGIKFATSTDTEVLYEFLKNYQYDDFKRLNGMWSFAFYNEKKEELLLSRDLLGERHLFYLINNNELIFSSEIAPILHVSQNSNELDFESIVTSWKFNSCSPGKTLIKNIFKLKPGTNLLFSDGKVKITQFQRLHPEKWFDYFSRSPSISEVNKKFEDIFYKEVDLRLPKEVNYFTALSGGIDSSLLAFFVSKFKTKVQTIFGVSSKTQEERKYGYSELESSYLIAKKLNLKHSHIDLITPECIKDINYSASHAFDGCIDPGVDNFAGLSTHLNKNNYKVMLFSDGVDEFLGGYQSDIEANKIDKIMGPDKPFKFLKYLTKTNFGKKILTSFLNLEKNKEFEFSYTPFYSRVNHSVCPNLFLKKIIQNYDANKKYDFGLVDPIYDKIITDMDYSQIRALNYASKTIPDMYNLRLDKAFMRHSVEVRLPFQSIEVAEMFIAMPNRYRFKNNFGKYFLRNYMAENVDQTISKRPKEGMGEYLWSDKEIYKNLNFEEEIRNTDFFENFPFKKNTKEILLKKNTHPGNLWAAYCFIKTYENLKDINKSK